MQTSVDIFTLFMDRIEFVNHIEVNKFGEDKATRQYKTMDQNAGCLETLFRSHSIIFERDPVFCVFYFSFCRCECAALKCVDWAFWPMSERFWAFNAISSLRRCIQCMFSRSLKRQFELIQFCYFIISPGWYSVGFLLPFVCNQPEYRIVGHDFKATVIRNLLLQLWHFAEKSIIGPVNLFNVK